MTHVVGARSHRSEVDALLKESVEAAALAGTCTKRQVGCLLLDRSGDVVLSGVNGTPSGARPCAEGGCVRCANAAMFPHGIGYDLCVCLHAEEAVLTAAAASGVSVRGGTMVTTYQPCIMCAKLIISSGLAGVRFLEPWTVPEETSGLSGLTAEYNRLWDLLPDGCTPLAPAARR